MKVFITILCVLTVIAVVVISTRFASRTSYAQDTFIAADHGYSTQLPTINSLPVLVNQVHSSIPVNSFGPVAAPPVHQIQPPSLPPVVSGRFALENGVSVPIQNKFPNPGTPQPTNLQSNTQQFSNPIRQPQTDIKRGSGSIRAMPPKTISRPAYNMGFGNSSPNSTGQATIHPNNFSQPAHRATVAWPKNAKNVKSLVRTEYSLPADAAESIVKFFAADGGDHIETEVNPNDESVLVTLQITTDEKTQRAIALFLDAVYPQTRLDTIQASAAPTESVKTTIPTDAPMSNQPADELRIESETTQEPSTTNEPASIKSPESH